MLARNMARLVAPIAIAAPILGGYLIVHHYAVSKHSHTSPGHVSTTRDKPKGKFANARFYTIRSGDNLTRIAARTGLTLGRLEQLNPRINPNALQTGQRIRLRR